MATVDAPPAPARNLRRREGEGQETTTLELFFDLVYVLAISQLADLLVEDLSWAGLGRTAFLLVVVWWAWIYTTWMGNWFDPEQQPVRLVLVLGMLASLLMAAAIPHAFSTDGGLFAVAYVVLQVGRNVATLVLLPRGHPMRDACSRFVVWSLPPALLWLAGGLLVHGDARLWLWGPALAVELLAPLVWYWLPGRGDLGELPVAVEGGHFAERFQLFLLIALGESIVLTGVGAVEGGLGASEVVALAVAFVETAGLWWLYFGEVAVHSLESMRTREDVTDVARDAYTYLHLPMVAGIVLSAVGDELTLAHPSAALTTAGALAVLGGPALFLLGELGFRWRMVRTTNPKRAVAALVLVALGAAAAHVSALVLSAGVAVVLCALAVAERTRRPEIPGV